MVLKTKENSKKHIKSKYAWNDEGNWIGHEPSKTIRCRHSENCILIRKHKNIMT